jgi:hypothetical protein
MTPCTVFKTHARRNVRWPNPADLSVAGANAVASLLYAGCGFVDETANGSKDIWWILEGQDYPRLWWETID